MPVRENIINNDSTYFITFTCTNWLPLFEKANAYNSVCKWFDFLHSSAKYFLTGEQGIYEVLHYKCLDDLEHQRLDIRKGDYKKAGFKAIWNYAQVYVAATGPIGIGLVITANITMGLADVFNWW